VHRSPFVRWTVCVEITVNHSTAIRCGAFAHGFMGSYQDLLPI
jgi:hypothetical protein